MEKENQTQSQPDFDKLNDRIIAQHTTSPTLVIKTNLDPKDATEENPYVKDHQNTTSDIKDFFSDK